MSRRVRITAVGLVYTTVIPASADGRRVLTSSSQQEDGTGRSIHHVQRLSAFLLCEPACEQEGESEATTVRGKVSDVRGKGLSSTVVFLDEKRWSGQYQFSSEWVACS